jgi:putative acetyltransferase
VTLMQLETGIRQSEAIALYRKFGYVERGPFGAYRPDPLSLFIEKKLPLCGRAPVLAGAHAI